ncbi:nibrin [Trichonephila clavipes]|nr:nibrin [Trichonephila clavipes]
MKGLDMDLFFLSDEACFQWSGYDRPVQPKISEELGIAQSVISRLCQRFQDDGFLHGELQVPFTTKRTSLKDNVSEGAGLFIWGGGIILGSRTDLHVHIGTITGQIFRDVILEQPVRLFRGTLTIQFVFSDDFHHHKRIPSVRNYHPYTLAIILTRLESSRACVGYA